MKNESRAVPVSRILPSLFIDLANIHDFYLLDKYYGLRSIWWEIFGGGVIEHKHIGLSHQNTMFKKFPCF